MLALSFSSISVQTLQYLAGIPHVCGLRFCEFPCFIKNGTVCVFLLRFVSRCFRKILGWGAGRQGIQKSLPSLSECICDMRAWVRSTQSHPSPNLPTQLSALTPPH